MLALPTWRPYPGNSKDMTWLLSKTELFQGQLYKVPVKGSYRGFSTGTSRIRKALSPSKAVLYWTGLYLHGLMCRCVRGSWVFSMV